MFNWSFYEFNLQSKALQKPQAHQIPEKLMQKKPRIGQLAWDLAKD